MKIQIAGIPVTGDGGKSDGFYIKVRRTDKEI